MGFHDLTMRNIEGDDVSFSDFKGQHCLIVNVASECGMTPQYEGLVSLHNSNQERQVTVLGFPCNQFGAQEPGSDAEICEFAKSTYQATFPLFSKVEVNGDGACALYQWLKSEKPHPNGKPDIAWNFTKFLVDANGSVVERFEPGVTPEEIGAKLAELI